MTKISNLISDFKSSFNTKQDAIAFLLRLKQNIEFNSTINWENVVTDLSILYKDNKPIYINSEFTSDPIDSTIINENNIFVFGSNTEGRHIGGAAKIALDKFGAINGQAKGLQGFSYAIQTVDYTEQDLVNIQTIKRELEDLFQFALDNQDKKFYLTKIGCGISGYSIPQIASLLENKIIPSNVIIPRVFYDYLIYQNHTVNSDNSIFYWNKGETVIMVDVNKLKIETITDDDYFKSCKTLHPSSKEEFTTASEYIINNIYSI